MLRDNLAGLIDPMVDRAGAHPLGGHHQAGPNGGCSRSTELGKRRSEAILGAIFFGGKPGDRQKKQNGPVSK
jgi:hypothetical protein